MVFSLVFFILTMLVFIGCAERNPSPSGHRPGGARLETVIIESVVERDLNEYIRLTGVLEGKTDITFNSEVSGQIVGIYKRLGDSVRRGEAIGKIDNAEQEIFVKQAESVLLAAQASLIAAQATYNANSSLYQENRLSSVEYQMSLSNYKNALATVQNASAQLELRERNLRNSLFRSPVDGRIVNLPIRVGQTIAPGQKIAGIADIRSLKIRSGVGENAIRSLQRGQVARISYRGNPDTFEGKVTGIGYKPLDNIVSYPIEIEMANPEMKLYPGMVVNVEIRSHTHSQVIYMLLNNVQKEYDQHFVYVVDAENTAHKTYVTLGKQINENVIILSGLKSGDMLVVEGFDNIADGVKVITRTVE
jgi:RND family efflux transporter MFP subunit